MSVWALILAFWSFAAPVAADCSFVSPARAGEVSSAAYWSMVEEADWLIEHGGCGARDVEAISAGAERVALGLEGVGL